MKTPYEFSSDEDKLVYVKRIAVSDLPAKVQEQANGLDTLFAVHSAAGEQLALVADEKLAFTLARQNDFAPVSVH